MKKVFFIVIILMCPYFLKAQLITGHISSGGSNPNGRIYVEIRDSIALIVPPDSINGWGYSWDHSNPYYSYFPAGDVDIPANIYYNNTPYPVRRIEKLAFSGCGNITSISIPNTITQIGNLAFGKENWDNTVTAGDLSSVIYSGTIAQWCKIYFGNRYSNPLTFAHTLVIGGNPVTDLVIPIETTLIKDFAFSGCNITSVTIPSDVWSICDGAFLNCTNLKTVYYNATSSSMGYNASVFEGCTNLRTVVIGENVQSINSRGFAHCQRLDTVFLKPTTPPYVFLGNSYFAGAFDDNAPNRVFVLSGCSYEDYYNDSYWYSYRSSLRDPIIDITVNASSSNTQQGTISIIKQRNHIVHCDSTAHIQANAKTGYHFDHWSDGSTSNPYTIHLAGDTAVIAYFASNTGINDIGDSGIIIYAKDHQIQIDEALGEDVSVYAIDGRTIASLHNILGHVSIPVTTSGVYIVKIGNHETRKVVVIR